MTARLIATLGVCVAIIRRQRRQLAEQHERHIAAEERSLTYVRNTLQEALNGGG